MAEEMTVRNESRMKEWAEIIETQQKSGLGIKEFCREHGVTESRYYYWRNRIYGTIDEEARPALVELDETSRSAAELPHTETLRIDYRGIKVEIPDSVNLDGLPELLRVMQSL